MKEVETLAKFIIVFKYKKNQNRIVFIHEHFEYQLHQVLHPKNIISETRISELAIL